MKPAVFLDRDGTINKEVHHLHKVSELRLLPGAARAIQTLNKLGFLVFIVTNQSVIGHGLATESEVAHIHDTLRKRLKNKGAYIDAVYFCPHHPEAKIKKYRQVCNCRKPGVDMIKQAKKDFPIDMKKSFIVGDMTSDIKAGARAKLTTILVATGHGGKDKRHPVTPTHTAKNLVEAVKVIKRSL